MQSTTPASEAALNKGALLAERSVLGQHLPAWCALEIYSLFTHTALDPVALRVL